MHPYLFIPPIECSTSILKELISLLFNISDWVRDVFFLLISYLFDFFNFCLDFNDLF